MSDRGYTILFGILTAFMFTLAATGGFVLGAFSWATFGVDIAALAFFSNRWGAGL